MTRFLLFAAALPLLAACTDPAGTPTASGTAAASGTEASGMLSVRTDSLLVSVDSLRYTVAIGYPQLAGSSATVPAAMVERVNAIVRDSVTARAEESRPGEPPPADTRDEPYYNAEVEGGTDNVMLRGDVFSALLNVYAFTGGAHGNTFYTPLNIDLRTGAPIMLDDVFQAGTAWPDTLSAYSGRALVAKIMENDPGTASAPPAETFYAEGYDAAAMRRATFTLGADSLTVHFVPYEVAFYAFGSTDVPIAYSALEAFLKPDGPVARIRGDR